MDDLKLLYDFFPFEADFDLSEHDDNFLDKLKTVVMIALFTNQRAENDDPLDYSDEKRGWWGDEITNIDENSQEKTIIGSRLWLLDRSKSTPEVLERAKIYIEEALEWLVSDNLVKSIKVNTSQDEYILLGQIEIKLNNGENFEYDFEI
ncbi:MAG: hypothetical protein GY757_09210 [bacterium]|nr:hypothetical protein [bacterium]